MAYEGTKFAEGALFAWGSTLYRATSPCEVWCGAMEGKQVELAQFELDCEPEEARKMLAAVGADTRYLCIGSDCGMDQDSDDLSADEMEQIRSADGTLQPFATPS